MTWQGNPRTTTTPHRHWRALILQRDPICQCAGCKHHTGTCTQPATEADHITPHANGGQLTLTNGQGLCHTCHQHKTSTEGNRTRWATRTTRPPESHPGLR